MGLMSFFARLAQILKSNLNDLISRSEDPEKMLDQVLRDMAEQLTEATKQVAVAIADEKGKRLVLLEDGKTTLPSAIFFRTGAAPVFGRKGIDAYINGDEGRLMRGLKKILGTSLMEEKTLIGSRAVGFTEILQHFISHLKGRADDAAGRSIDHVIMGRPVHFHDDDGDADTKSQNTLENIDCR